MNKRILVIDDDPDILEALKFTLSSAGYVVAAYEKGEYAEELQKPHLPDVIILDVLLSGKDGREITKILKKRDETKDIPVILISAHPDLQSTFKTCGANDFLAKPFDVDDLLNKIERHTKKDKKTLN